MFKTNLSTRSPSSIIQSGWTASPVPGPSIIPVDNDSNWEDAPTTNPITNLTANRPTSSTCSWSKHHQSNNTNEQLAEVLSQLANILNSNQTPRPNTNSRGTKVCIPDTFSGTEPDKLNNFLFQCHLLSQIRYSLVVILELNGVSEVQYKDVMMVDDGKYQ